MTDTKPKNIIDTKSLYMNTMNPVSASFEDDLIPLVQSYPSLGQASQIQKGGFTLTAVLEVPSSRKDEPWEVAAWHSIDDGEWTECQLAETSPDHRPRQIQGTSDRVSRLVYSVSLTVQSSMQFTLKFRHGENEPWRWTRDELGMGDGLVIVDNALARSLSENLGDLIKELDPAWEVQSLLSQAPRTRLWSLRTEVSAAKGDKPATSDTFIGVPWGHCVRWFALIRDSTSWMAPRHGKSRFHLDKDGVVCSFLSSQGKHLVLLALSGLNNVASVFRSHDDKGGIMFHAQNDSTEAQSAIVLVAVGDSFESANAAVMYEARNAVRAKDRKPKAWLEEANAILDDVKPEWMENWYDGLGFCTWNALGQRLTEKKVLDAVDKLAEHKVKVTNLLIDDNWQSIDYAGHGQFQHGWVEFEAEKKSFPNGLKGMVSQIRGRHPHIQHIAVWHALLGYWGGISPDGKLARDYKTVEVVREDIERDNLPLDGKMTVVAKEDVDAFYDDFYKFLASCGIDGVKTDVQSMMDTWVSASARRDLIEAYLDAWTISSLRHFSIKAISCMSQVPQIMFYNQMPRRRPPVLCRNSDDFFPDEPTSHPWHVWANAHNTLLTQHLNTLPDWDMFQTAHEYSGFHAAARCVSGGPIYITDVPGEHNVELIRQMTGTTIRGKTVIFRPSVLGKTVDVYQDYKDEALLKVGSYHGAAVTGTPILAVFNVSSRSLTEILSIGAFPGVLPSLKYVVRAHKSGRVTSPITPGDPGATGADLMVALDVRGYEIFTAYALSAFDSEGKGKMLVANLGLLGKMTGAAAIVSSDVELERNGKVELKARLKALGVLGIYISKLDELTIEDDFIATIQGQVIPVDTVSVSQDDKHVLEIDIQRAWEEMALRPGWGNEVEVKVTFSIEHEES